MPQHYFIRVEFIGLNSNCILNSIRLFEWLRVEKKKERKERRNSGQPKTLLSFSLSLSGPSSPHSRMGHGGPAPLLPSARASLLSSSPGPQRLPGPARASAPFSSRAQPPRALALPHDSLPRCQAGPARQFLLSPFLAPSSVSPSAGRPLGHRPWSRSAARPESWRHTRAAPWPAPGLDPFGSRPRSD
jgi:hypothetical protein